MRRYRFLPHNRKSQIGHGPGRKRTGCYGQIVEIESEEYAHYILDHYPGEGSLFAPDGSVASNAPCLRPIEERPSEEAEVSAAERRMTKPTQEVDEDGQRVIVPHEVAVVDKANDQPDLDFAQYSTETVMAAAKALGGSGFRARPGAEAFLRDKGIGDAVRALRAAREANAK